MTFEELQNKVAELERRLAEKEKTIDEFDNRLTKTLINLDEPIRNEKDIVLKKNFFVKARKAIERSPYNPNLSKTRDNVITMSFAEDSKNAMNHIFIGSESLAGNYNTTSLQGVAVKKKSLGNSANNGSIQFILIREDQVKKDNTLASGTTPQISIEPMENYFSGATGEIVMLTATGENGMVQIGGARNGVVNGFAVDFDETAFFNKVLFYNSLILPNLPAAPEGINGSIYYDTSLKKVRVYQNNKWENIK